MEFGSGLNASQNWLKFFSLYLELFGFKIEWNWRENFTFFHKNCWFFLTKNIEIFLTKIADFFSLKIFIFLRTAFKSIRSTIRTMLRDLTKKKICFESQYFYHVHEHCNVYRFQLTINIFRIHRIYLIPTRMVLIQRAIECAELGDFMPCFVFFFFFSSISKWN